MISSKHWYEFFYYSFCKINTLILEVGTFSNYTILKRRVFNWSPDPMKQEEYYFIQSRSATCIKCDVTLEQLHINLHILYNFGLLAIIHITLQLHLYPYILCNLHLLAVISYNSSIISSHLFTTHAYSPLFIFLLQQLPLSIFCYCLSNSLLLLSFYSTLSIGLQNKVLL